MQQGQPDLQIDDQGEDTIPASAAGADAEAENGTDAFHRDIEKHLKKKKKKEAC